MENRARQILVVGVASAFALGLTSCSHNVSTLGGAMMNGNYTYSSISCPAPGSDGKVDETGSLGEASASCAGGAGDGITAHSVGWTTITLQPGRHELVCNLPNHYTDGMYQELDVT
jgi:hypothetical protein